MTPKLTSIMLSLAVTLAMAFSLFPTPVATASPDTIPSHTQAVNWTISNNTKQIDGPLALTLVLGFGLVLWGMRSKEEYHWMFLAGFVWIFSSITVLLEYGLGWMVIGLGIGLTVLAEGAIQYGAGDN